MDIDGLLLPFRPYSIEEFIHTAATIRDNEGDPHRFSSFERFVLTGRHEHEGHQVTLDPIRNRIPNHLPALVNRDYDSLIGISDHIRLTSAPLFVSPVARNDQTLTSTVHLGMPVGQSHTEVPFHKIPNIHLGKWGERNAIRIIFPGLWNARRTGVQLSAEEQAELYEKGIRPAIVALGEDATDWPATYQDELWRARRDKGGFAFRAVPLGEWCLPLFGDRLREELEERGVNWAFGFKFMHQVRGVKAATHHSPLGRNPQGALDEFLAMVNLSTIGNDDGADDDWWIDVGLEIHSPGHCLEWRTDSHASIVEHVLRISTQRSQEITSLGSSKYSRDISSHLVDVSGCRIEPGVRSCGPFRAKYLQVYTTDKSPTYHPQGQFHGKAIKGEEVLNAKETPAFCRGLYDAYCNSAAHHDSNARIEVRVPLQYGSLVLRSFPDALIRGALLAFARAVWWNYRGWLLLAATEVLTAQIEGDGRFRSKPNALLLTTGLIWWINGLHSRPMEGRSCRELVRAILPHTDHPPNHFLGDRDTDSNSDSDADLNAEGSGPWTPSGVIFFRNIMLPPDCSVPRMKHGRSITDRALLYFFKKDYRSIQRILDPVGILNKDDIPDSRIPTRKGMTQPCFNDDEPDRFNLGERGYALPPPQIDAGDDMDVEEAEGLNDDPNATLDGKLTAIWYQFLIDVIQKAPNPKGQLNVSYCRVQEKDRVKVRDAFYQNHSLSDVWRVCQYKASRDLWQNTFGRLWPPKGHVLSATAQNYRSCLYYLDWKRFQVSVPEDIALVARAEIKKKFDRLYWIPAATSDKMWNTNKAGRGFITLPDGYNGPAPQLLINGGQEPIWVQDA